MEVLPVAATLACGVGLTWQAGGSIAAGSWLPYAIVVALAAAVALLAGGVAAPRRIAIVGPAALLALGVWAGASLTRAPLPSLARDEGLLTALYAIVLALTVATLWTRERRSAAVGALCVATGGLAVAAAVVLAAGSDPTGRYFEGRLSFPISYANADAAVFALALWPGVALAARRNAPVAIRGIALGLAAGAAAGSLLAQSKGAAFAFLVSLVVVLAVSPARLRLLVPLALLLLGAGLAAPILIAPYGADDGQAIRHAGRVAIGLAVAVAVAGMLYAAVERRVEVSARVRRAAAILVGLALAAAVAAGIAAFFVSIERPGQFFEQRWTALTHPPGKESSTHYLTLGSSRWDYWRVSVHELARQPLVGIGARGFGPDYLVHGRSYETPARPHSLPLAVLGEQGIVGFVLLALGVGVPLALAGRAVCRGRWTAAAALGAGTVWLVQACVDWTWSFPAVTVPALVAIGIGVADDRVRTLPAVAARRLAAAAGAVAVLVFAPPWLSSRFTQAAIASGSQPDLRWARRLDPLSPDPLLAEAQIEPLPAALPALRRAARMEPRAVAARYAVGVAYLQAGDPFAARRELRAALRLKPGDPLIREALVASARPSRTPASRRS